jgi:trehalose utilization protein
LRKAVRPVAIPEIQKLMKTLLRFSGGCLLLTLVLSFFPGVARAQQPIRVLVWDERQPAQKQVYTNFLGNQIAGYLQGKPGLKVTSVGLDDPGQGLSHLADFDVLIWWGHQRHREISTDTARGIVERIKAGRLSLISLHSAHWSEPFVQAMNERARADALAALAPDERGTAKVVETNVFANRFSQPKYSDLRTPAALYRKTPDGSVNVKLTLPNCCFPAYRNDGKPSQIRVLLPEHPIAQGLPAKFTIEQTEMYDEPFHVPAPDQVVLEERWQTGEWFRSGSVWQVGQGKVFYFRPGHETYAVYHNPNALRIVENAVRWLGERPK